MSDKGISPAPGVGTPTPPPVPAAPGTKKAASISDLDIASLPDLARKLSYAGFSTGHIRELCVKKIPAADLLKLLVAAAEVGNAPERLNGKIQDPTEGANILRLMTMYKVMSAGATGPDDLTLARIATAFGPLYFKVRVQIKASLQDQSFGLGTPVEWQSPSLAMYSDLSSATNLRPWLLAFGRRIKPTKETDEMSDVRTEQFRQLSVANRDNDNFLSTINLELTIKQLVNLAYG
jgi:hypothetical protein